MKIFITGGAGYVGTALIPALLELGHEVKVYDSLMFNNGDKLLPYTSNKLFSFVKGDIRDKELLKSSIKGYDVVIHLAALVGYPICRERGKEESYEINTVGTQNVIDSMSDTQYLLYGSTGSNYGEVVGICTEDTPLNPLSIYGETKTLAEKLVMQRKNSTAFRFATAFGVSSRLRLDLLINDLTYQIYKQRYANIFQPHFLRTFIHVKDMARVFIFAIDNMEKMKDNIYNVGSDSMNFSKKEICEIIKSKMPFPVEFNYSGVGEDPDKRNYKVSYSKLKELGFDTTISIEDGIDELIKSFSLIKISSQYHNVY